MSYFSKIVNGSFAEAVAKVTVEVKEEGFGSTSWNYLEPRIGK